MIHAEPADSETIIASKLFSEGLGSNFYDCRFDNAQFIEGSRTSYVFNSSIQEIENDDAILLIGSNPRWEASVLNVRIRKAYLQNDCKIGIIGKNINLNYNFIHLSNSISHINEIHDGTSFFCKILNEAKNPLIIIGTSAINHEEGQNVLNNCAEIAKKLPNSNNNFNPLNILHQDISRVGALDLGYYNSLFNFSFEENLKNIINKTKPVVFLIGQDEIDMEVLNDAFVVYLGHHGDKGASVADIILPTPAYTEKTSTYVNTEGRVLQTSKCHSSLGEAKEEWKIFRALSDSFGNILKFNNLQELRKKLLVEHSMLSLIHI